MIGLVAMLGNMIDPKSIGLRKEEEAEERKKEHKKHYFYANCEEEDKSYSVLTKHTEK